MKCYVYVVLGGWWCFGIDLLFGEKDLWGCFKFDCLRQDGESSKIIKYEYFFKIFMGIFVLWVFFYFWERIVVKVGVVLIEED